MSIIEIPDINWAIYEEYIETHKSAIEQGDTEYAEKMLTYIKKMDKIIAKKGKTVCLRSHPSADNFFGLKTKQFLYCSGRSALLQDNVIRNCRYPIETAGSQNIILRRNRIVR